MTKAAKIQKQTADAPKNVVTVSKLYTWNKWLAVLHAAQGLAILLLGATRNLPVTTNYLTVDPIASAVENHPVLATATRQLFEVNVACLIAVFFFVTALAHLAAASFYRKRYEADLQKGMNRLRWIEYGLSASTMIVAIGFLSGVYELSNLIMLFALTLIMSLLGLAMEVYNQGKKQPNWLAYWIGCVAGFVPWVVIGLYIFGANAYGGSHIPTFVYWIYLSMFLFFSSFAINMYVQYKKQGKWTDYLYGERTYMVLSLLAKSALAWQVFAGMLRP